jgi:ATPase subunit of ABC transporter with duplicated ATPase domains
MENIIELTSLGASCYGGNYDDYAIQKNIEKAAREQNFNDAKKLMQKTKNTANQSRIFKKRTYLFPSLCITQKYRESAH